MATDVDVEIKRVSQAGYYDYAVFNITDQDKITLVSVQHRMYLRQPMLAQVWEVVSRTLRSVE